MKKYIPIIFYIFVFSIYSTAQVDNKIKYEHQDFTLGTNSFIKQVNAGNITTYESNKYFDSPIKNPQPFLATAFKIYGSEQTSEDIIVQVRTNISTGWIEFDYDEDIENINGELSSGLLYLDSKTTKYQFRIIVSNTKISISNIDFIFISPGKTSQAELNDLKKFEPINFRVDLSINKLSDNKLSFPRPPVVTRTAWGCPQGQGSLGSPSVTIPNHLIVHHSAGSNTSSDWPAVVRSIYTLHTQTNGWSDIGYNWLIDPNGIIYQGRAWYQNISDNVLGAHFCGTNSQTMGVCVMGTYTSVSPTTEAKLSLVNIFAYKADEQNIDPLGISYHSSSGLTLYNICGHRNGCATECPGTNLYNQLPQIRDSVNALLNLTSIDENKIIVDKFFLDQNYPNPFNPKTTISWYSPVSSWQTLKVYDVLGNEVVTLVNEYKDAGRYKVDFDAPKITSGIYYYQLRTGKFVETKKMILLR